MKIIFDLDGTLIDASERMYQVFQTLIPQSFLTKNEYWKLKRNGFSHKMILSRYFPEVSFEEFNSRWMKKIETEKYIHMDQNYPDSIDVLCRLRNKFYLYLLTSRQRKNKLEEELERLMLRNYFTDILLTEGKCSKENLLIQYIKYHADFLDNVKYFISDTGKDIMLGNAFGLTTVAITHGFMNRNKLEEYQPNYIVETLTELVKLDS